MKKKSIQSVACIALSACLFTSCIGSFALWNKVKDWNMELTNSKFVNELVFICLNIVPVYEICGVADLFVINAIEFWSGENPVVSQVGKTRQVLGSDGVMYAVTNLKDGYEIKNPMGEVVNFVYDKGEKTWSVETEKGTVKLMRIKNRQTAELFLENGRSMEVSLNEQGLHDARMAVNGGYYFATRY